MSDKPAESETLTAIETIAQKDDINPWLRLFVYCLACLFTSCLYFGWQDFSTMIIKSGAYQWKCHENDDTINDGPALCLDQSKAVAALYPWANGSEFVCAAIAGVLLDSFGPKLTASVGESLHLLSIVMLVISAERIKLYIPALILSGACVNIITFPSLTIMEQWPNRQALAVSIIVGCQSAASIVAPILRIMWDRNPHWTFRKIWLVWLCIIWLPVSGAYIWSLPTKRNYNVLLATSVKPINISTSETEVVDLSGHLIKASSGNHYNTQ